MIGITILRAGPLTTVQDDGRPGLLRHGISASGPMDRGAFLLAGQLAGGGEGGIEFTASGMAFAVDGGCRVGLAGGGFGLRVNGQEHGWPAALDLRAGDWVEVVPGSWGNYGYVRFRGQLALSPVLGSIATNSRTGLGGLDGRNLVQGDRLTLTSWDGGPGVYDAPTFDRPADDPIRMVWGIHADLFALAVRQAFIDQPLLITAQMDRMGVRLGDPQGIFAGQRMLSLVSDALVAGDIQILGDGTPIVLMRDHQPTGGYPRIGTIITADLDRFAQMRPGSAVAFSPVSVEHAQRILRGAAR